MEEFILGVVTGFVLCCIYVYFALKYTLRKKGKWEEFIKW